VKDSQLTTLKAIPVEQIESTKQYLKQAFRIDPNWRLQALDEDLKPSWDYLGGLNKGHQPESPLYLGGIPTKKYE